MAEKLGEALLDLDTDDKKFNQGVDRAEKRADKLGKVLDDTAVRAAKLGGALAAAAGVAGAAALTSGIVGAVKRLEEMRKMSGQVDQALKNSGNTARTSAQEIEAWADALENRTGRAVEEVMGISANLASYGFGREEFFRAIELADDMAAAWGGDLKQNLEGLARALDDPINGMAMLSKRGIKLTDEQKQMAAAFLEAGQKVKAQGVVFEALEAQVKGVAEAGFTGLTKSIAQAQKVWETAFEDLVTGRGNAADLRDTLSELIATLSSPEFVDAAMGFGSLMVDVIKAIADAAIAAHAAVRDIRDFFASGDQEVSTVGLQAELDRNIEKVAELRAQWNALGTDAGDAKNALANDAQGLMDRNRTIEAELARRKALEPAPIVTTGGGSTGGGSNGYKSDATKDIEKQRKAVEALIAELTHERDIVGLSAQEQQILNTIRRAGETVTKDQANEIRNLITETEEHRAQLEQMEEYYGLVGDVGKTAIMGIVDAMADGQVEGEELLSILGDVLSMAGSFFLNQAFGSGDGGFSSLLSGIFAGMFADGGLIPSGQFGIVGENGPEPVWGGAGGTRVMSNPDFMSMLGSAGGGRVNNVTVNGSGLSQAELTQAITDALDRYDRFQLPGRVAAIQADPYARG